MFPFDISNIDPEFMESMADPAMQIKFQELMTLLPTLSAYEQAAAIQKFAMENFSSEQLVKMQNMAMSIPEEQRQVIIDQTNRMLYTGKPSAHFSIDESGLNANFEVYELGRNSEADAPIFVAFADKPDRDFIAEVDTFLGQQNMVVWSSQEEMQAFGKLHREIIGS
ncbi:hypothetical protein [Lactovum miscens]|uniref:Uncharacterized protein n=1 Tax=Lactovum miscens TaxID=190387 RepID=A0A841C8D0_9LACT|nr:hypothetical protein [Lactovum miscens]MBB5888604.1 hypothetical protein [Lactovum miscens]